MLRAYIDAEAGKEKCLKISAKAKLSKSNLYLICFKMKTFFFNRLYQIKSNLIQLR